MKRQGKPEVRDQRSAVRPDSSSLTSDIKQIKEGEWIFPKRKGYRWICCACGGEHLVDFDLIDWGRGKAIVFRMWRIHPARF